MPLAWALSQEEKPASQTPGRKDTTIHLPKWRPLGDLGHCFHLSNSRQFALASVFPPGLGRYPRCSAEGPEPALERADFSLATGSPGEWLSLSTLTPFLLLLALLGPDTEHKGAPESHPKGQDLEQLIFVPIFQNLRLPSHLGAKVFMLGPLHLKARVPAGGSLHP